MLTATVLENRWVNVLAPQSHERSSNLGNWSIFAAAVLLSPVLPFVMAGMLMNVVAVLKYADPPAFPVLVAVGICRIVAA